MLKYKLLGATALLAVAPALATAQTASPAGAVPQANPAVVGEVIVTAQRRSEKLKDVPMSVAAATGAQLQAAGISSTRGLQQLAPGLTFTTQGAWAEPNLRGVTTGSSGAGEESPIAIYVDGVYIVNQVAGVFDLPDVANVQVLKGPQGTLFGRNAEGGAILIDTKDPKFTAGGDITGTFGYFTGGGGSIASPDYGIKGFLTGPMIDDRLAGSVSFYVDSVNGYLNNIGTHERDGAIHNGVYRSKLLFEPNNTMRFQLEGWYAKEFNDADGPEPNLQPGTYSTVQYYPDGVIPYGHWQTAHDYPVYIDSESYGGSFKATVEFDPGTLTSLTSTTHTRNEIRVDVSGAYLPEPDRHSCYASFKCIDYQVLQMANSVSEELIWNSKQYDKFSYVGGAFIFHSEEYSGAVVNAVDCPGCYDTNSRVPDDSYAFFTEGNYKILDNLTLTAGGRVSYEKKSGFADDSYTGETFDGVTGHLDPMTLTCVGACTGWFSTYSKGWGSFTPRVSLRYAIDPESNVYASFSQGFKSGVINPSSPYNVVKPEHLTAWEVGYKRNTSLYSVSLSGFYYDYHDIQIQVFQGTGTDTLNAASAQIAGLDFDGTLRVTHDLRLRLAVSYLPKANYGSFTNAAFYGPPLTPYGTTAQSGNDTGDRLLKTPVADGTVSLDYTRETPWGMLDASASVYYTQKYPWELGYRLYTNAYALVNGQIALTPANSNVTVTIFGKNLTNAWYMQGLVESANSDMVGNPPPREVGVSLGYKF